MKYMGWSYQDLLSCPHSYYLEIIRLLNEAEEERQHQELMRS